MSALAAMRAQLAADLAGLAPLGVTVSDQWPQAMTPPVAFVTPALTAAWIEPGPNFSEYLIGLDVVLLVDHGASGPALFELETLVEAALGLLSEWGVTEVEPPAPTSVADNGAEYLAAVIHLTQPTQL